MMSTDRRLEEIFKQKVVSSKNVGGGCINQTRAVLMTDGNELFVKTNANADRNLFLAESEGLQELRKAAEYIGVPDVLYVDETMLVLQKIKTEPKQPDFYARYGQSLAKMHRISNERFGFHCDNFIGELPQKNQWHTDWSVFWWKNRIEPQLQMADEQLSDTDLTGFEKLRANLGEILGPTADDNPSLIHGDLWGGNHLCGENNRPVLIDPAVYYGHREADLAMTAMFHSYPREFYRAYEAEWPLVDGFWQVRQYLYLLYHYLSHLNHFGGGYYNGVINCLRKLPC